MDIPSGHFIGDDWLEHGGAVLESREAFSDAPLWHGKHARASACTSAMDAARAAWPAWSRTAFDERVAALRQYQERLRAHQEELAVLLSRENGKPLWEARTEAAALVAKIDLTLEAWQERCGEREFAAGSASAHLRSKSLGVCVVLGPFNLPMHLANGQIVPALLAGNTIVFKPSEWCPASGAAMFDLLRRCVPPGVVNLIHGDAAVATMLLEHEHLAAVFFTGSRRAGVAIHKQFAGRPEIMLALEMGGNNPLVLWQAADKEAAALVILQSAFITAGQRCVCARRLIIPEGDEGDACIAALLRLLKRVRVGDPLAGEQPFMGGVIHAAAARRVLAAQEAWQQRGGKSLLTCHRMDEAHPSLLSPGLIDMTDCERDDEEIFGPLLQIIRVADFDAALQEANQTSYGLSAGLISDSAELYQRFVTEVRAGIINWNRQITGASGKLPFGGIGASGNHRAAAWYAVDFCCDPCASIELQNLEAGALPVGVQEDSDD